MFPDIVYYVPLSLSLLRHLFFTATVHNIQNSVLLPETITSSPSASQIIEQTIKWKSEDSH